MLPLRRSTQAVLLELALADLLANLRRSLDRNRRGDGSPAAAYCELAQTLSYFELMGGLDAVSDALAGWADLDTPPPPYADVRGEYRAAADRRQTIRPDRAVDHGVLGAAADLQQDRR